MASPTALADRAAATLRANDAGAYTLPARDQYPHMWNWDSAFCALGWAALDPDRAWTEMESLLAAQDAEGLVPSIAYRPGAGGYAPHPEWWGRTGGDGRAISAISQPPVAATCLRLLHGRHPAADRARALMAPLKRWHDFLLSRRDPFGLGEPTVIHPWESGRDNAAEWDAALAAVPAAVRPEDVQREDVLSVAAADRPKDADYSGYLSLVKLGQKCGWNQRELAASGWFRVLDPGFSAILARACHDLAALARELGDETLARRSAAQARRVSAALVARADGGGLVHAVNLWPGVVRPRDLVGDRDLQPVGAGSALVLLAPELPGDMVGGLRDMVASGALASRFGVRSLQRDDPAFSPRRYWRGPVWANITWLCALGLDSHGEHDAAALLRERMLASAAAGGIREYVEPETGAGRGARDFSWTAALALWELSA